MYFRSQLCHSSICGVSFVSLFIGLNMSCRKPENNANIREPRVTVIEEEFQPIFGREKKAPTLPTTSKVKVIELVVYTEDFDHLKVKEDSLTVSEWDTLKKILESGEEVKNVKLLALSAQINFLDKQNNAIASVSLYWTSQTGDVYFDNSQGWFRVSNRGAIRRVLGRSL
jgi:hypothetical protein